MAVEDRAKELNSVAEKIQGMFSTFRSQFKSISNKRKRIRRNIAEKKKRDAKLRSASSSFGKSIGNIKSKVLSGPSSILGKVLNFASLLLFGVAINSIAGVSRKVDDESKMMKEKSDNTGNFITGMVAGIQNFIAGFGLMEKKVNNTFDDVDNSIKNAENDLQQFKGDADKLDDFNLSNILTDSTQDEREDKLEEEKSIDPKFKKGNSKSDLRRNAIKTDNLLKEKDIELVKTEGLTPEDKKKNAFTKRLFKQLDTNELNIDNLQLSTDAEDIGDGVEEKIIIIRQREIVKQ